MIAFGPSAATDGWFSFRDFPPSSGGTSNSVAIAIPARRSDWREEEGVRKFKEAAARAEAAKVSRLLALDPRPALLPAPVPKPGPDRTGQDRHWTVHRRRCPRMRAPVRGYGRA